MKYVGWFLFNVVVFVWSLVGSIRHGSWAQEAGGVSIVIGLLAFFSGLGVGIFIIVWVFRRVNAIRRYRRRQENRATETANKLYEMSRRLTKIHDMVVSIRGFLTTLHHTILAEKLTKKPKKK